MLFDAYFSGDTGEATKRVERLETFHQRHFSLVLGLLFIGLIAFVLWASFFRIDQVARAHGEVIASSRVQVIQAVDGGVLAELNVKEGDRVAAGEIMAVLDQTRFGASVKEIEAGLAALKAKATRLRAEVTGRDRLHFSDTLTHYPELVQVEKALFQQRRSGLQGELRTLNAAVQLAKEEADLVSALAKSGDVNRSEVIRTARALNDAEAKIIIRKNRYLEEASSGLTKIENELAQNRQVLTQRKQQLNDSVFKAMRPGIVKNVRVTTVGGVLRPGEELMQIIPVDDDLIIETKVSPSDIAKVRPGLEATIRFDPFDYTIYGGVVGEVVYVSADTIKEESRYGLETFYRVHVIPSTKPVTTTTGRRLDVIPGMTAQVDIRTGKRSVMDYLLKPVRKTLSESLGER